MSDPSDVAMAMVYAEELKDVADCHADRCILVLAAEVARLRDELAAYKSGEHARTETFNGIAIALETEQFHREFPRGVNTTDHVADASDPVRDRRNSEEPE